MGDDLRVQAPPPAAIERLERGKDSARHRALEMLSGQLAVAEAGWIELHRMDLPAYYSAIAASLSTVSRVVFRFPRGFRSSSRAALVSAVSSAASACFEALTAGSATLSSE